MTTDAHAIYSSFRFLRVAIDENVENCRPFRCALWNRFRGQSDINFSDARLVAVEGYLAKPLSNCNDRSLAYKRVVRLLRRS